MPNLLLCFYKMRHKDYYFTVNLLDILFQSFFMLNLMFNDFYKELHINKNVELMLSLSLLLTATSTLLIFLHTNSYISCMHKFYMVLRIFVVFFQYTFCMLLFVYLLQMNKMGYYTPEAYQSHFLMLLGFLFIHMFSIFWTFVLIEILK